MDKLTIKISDWLGNQMFQYAFGKYLSKKLQKDLYIDISSYDNNPTRKFELDKFHTEYKIAHTDEIPLYTFNKQKNKILKKIYWFNKFVYYVINIFLDTFITPLLIKLKKKYICQKNSWIGFHSEYLDRWLWYYAWFWQSEIYFPNIRKQLLQDFTLKNPLDDKNLLLQEKMKNYNSVAVHVRRWDYTIKKSLFRHSLYPCSLDYYNKSIEYIKKQIQEPVFFFFSDDPIWVKKNIQGDGKSYYIDHNTWDNSYKDMILMSSCKHNIIANSTFSRWGAWLNTNNDKIVIAPIVRFSKTKRNNMTTNLIPNNRIKF